MSTQGGNPHRHWRPPGATGEKTAQKLPEPGRLIVFIFSRQPWRVIEVTDRRPADWSEETNQAWLKAKEQNPETWAGRERMVLCEPPYNPVPNGKDRRGFRLSPWWHEPQWYYLTDPFPACVSCGLLWPCPCDDRNKAAEAAMKELERLGGVLPGCCWACSEPITKAHRSIEFPGENLALPGAPPPVFHTAASRKSHRGTCRSEAIAYEKKWVEAEPARAARLTCGGVLFRHYRDSECTYGPLCPGEDADHERYAYCTSGTYTRTDDGQVVEHRPLTNCGERGCRGVRVDLGERQEAT